MAYPARGGGGKARAIMDGKAKVLGERVRELRTERDLSLRELATRIGVSVAFMSDVELGRRRPSDNVLLRIARELGSSMDDLRRYDSRPPLREMREMAARDPQYGLAFRRMVDADVQPDEIMRFLRDRNRRPGDGAGR